MGLYHYAMQMEDNQKSAKAQTFDQNASYKDLTQVTRAIRGKQVEEAREILEECVALKTAIPYYKHCKGLGSRGEIGGKKGRYPKKEARLMLNLLNDAVANAKNQGMTEKNLYVAHAAGYKQNKFKRYRKYWAGGSILGYGKQATWADYETARAEIVLGEREPRVKKAREHGAHKHSHPKATAEAHKTEKTVKA